MISLHSSNHSSFTWLKFRHLEDGGSIFFFPDQCQPTIVHNAKTYKTMIKVQKCFLHGRYLFCCKSVSFRGTRWRSWLRHCATNRKVRFPVGDLTLPAALGPEVDSAFNRNEYQGYILGVDNSTTFSWRLSKNSGSLNHLER